MRAFFTVRSAVPVDINKDLKRYTCQANIEFDEQALQTIALRAAVIAVWSTNDTIQLLMIAEASAKRGDSRGYAIIFNVVLPQNVPRMIVITKNMVPTTFTVQPEDPMSSANSKYIVTLGDR